MAETKQGKATIAIDPVTRIEGHMKVEVVVEDGKVVDAKISGGMFRGFENILRGRDPRDVPQIVQRICGVCPTAHATASSMAIESLGKVKVPGNGRVTRNLMLGANYLQSHLLHFYHLAGQDFIMGPDTPPFVPRMPNPDLRLPANINAVGVDQYLEALEVRAICHEMVALFGGRMPHVHGLMVGGAAQVPTKESLVEFAVRFKKVRAFVEEKYLPTVYLIGSYYKDMATFGQGHRSAMCVGVFPQDDKYEKHVFESGVYYKGKFEAFDPAKVTEDVKYSWFADSTSGRNFEKSKTVLDLDKKDAYSFGKAPLYDGRPMEVGPLPRLWINNAALSPVGRKMLKEHFGIEATTIRDLGEDVAFSLLGRHIARAEETWAMIGVIEGWLREVKPDEKTWVAPALPQNAEGYATTEAPRGSLIHFGRVSGGKIADWAILPATLWNTAPRNDLGIRGALEECMIGVPVPDIDSPVNVSRLIRAFDP